MNHTMIAKKQLYKIPKKQPEKFDLLEPNVHKKMFHRLTPEMWVEQYNLICELDESLVDFEEVPESYKGKETLYKVEKRAAIRKAKQTIYRGVVEFGWIDYKQFSIDQVLSAWQNIIELNFERAMKLYTESKRDYIGGKIMPVITRIVWNFAGDRMKKQQIQSAYLKRYLELNPDANELRAKKELQPKVTNCLLRLEKRGAIIKEITKYNEEYYKPSKALKIDKNNLFYIEKP